MKLNRLSGWKHWDHFPQNNQQILLADFGNFFFSSSDMDIFVQRLRSKRWTCKSQSFSFIHSFCIQSHLKSRKVAVRVTMYVFINRKQCPYSTAVHSFLHRVGENGSESRSNKEWFRGGLKKYIWLESALHSIFQLWMSRYKGQMLCSHSLNFDLL